jgi:hypothetical protein
MNKESKGWAELKELGDSLEALGYNVVSVGQCDSVEGSCMPTYRLEICRYLDQDPFAKP